MDRSFAEGNKAVRERIKATVAKLSEDDLNKSVGHGWTVRVALAHIAFWDKKRLGQLEEWERIGARNVQFPPPEAEVINPAMLPEWQAMPGDQVKRDVVANAEAVDKKLESISDDLLDLLLEKQPGIPFRTRHRGEHLEEVDRALGR